MTHIELKGKYIAGYQAKKTKVRARVGNSSGVTRHKKKHKFADRNYRF